MERTLEEVFTAINWRCFWNRLPQIRLSFSKRKLKNDWAYFISDTRKPAYIKVNMVLRDQPVRLMRYMIHEVVHLWQFMTYERVPGTIRLRKDMLHSRDHNHDLEFWMIYNWCINVMGVKS